MLPPFRMLLSFLLLFVTTSLFARTAVVLGPKGERYHTGLLPQRAADTGAVHFTPAPVLGLPDEYDSRAAGHVSPIKNQGSCGSCWAFAMTKAFESHLAVTGHDIQDLSEQDWVSNARGHYGCNGGFMNADFAVEQGVYQESDCPYKARNGVACNTGTKTKAMRWGFVGERGRAPTLEEIKAAVYQYGALAVTVAAGSGLSSAADDGSVARCSDRSINHMVTVVGWKADGKLIMANSWGEGYGDGGFAYLEQGCNKLASTSNGALYVVADQGPGPIPPEARLPVEVLIGLGGEALIGVRAEPGVSYEWSTGETGNLIVVKPTVDTTYELKATNAAGTSTSSVLVKIVRQESL